MEDPNYKCQRAGSHRIILWSDPNPGLSFPAEVWIKCEMCGGQVKYVRKDGIFRVVDSPRLTLAQKIKAVVTRHRENTNP